MLPKQVMLYSIFLRILDVYERKKEERKKGRQVDVFVRDVVLGMMYFMRLAL